MGEKIDIFIIGAQKAGTTSLKNYLGEHPQINTHTTKEFSYFYDDEEYNAGFINSNLYNFNNQIDEKKLIVCKHAHLYSSEKAIIRLKKNNPNCKIIFILRDPVNRTFSSYLMEKMYNRVDFEFDDLKNILEGNSLIKMEQWQQDAIISFSIYHQYLEVVYKHFNKEQVQLILFEDFSKNPLKYCKQIFLTCGINDEFRPRVRTIHNQTTSKKSKYYANFLKHFLIEKNSLKSIVKRMLPNKTTHELGEKLRNANRSKKYSELMSEELKIFLSDYFFTHNKKLEELTGLNLQHWGYHGKN